jgi:hypothetical protein
MSGRHELLGKFLTLAGAFLLIGGPCFTVGGRLAFSCAALKISPV